MMLFEIIRKVYRNQKGKKLFQKTRIENRQSELYIEQMFSGHNKAQEG